CRGNGEPAQQHLDDLFSVEGVGHRLPDSDIFENCILQVEAQVGAAVALSGENLQFRCVTQGLDLVGSEVIDDQIDASLEQLLLAGDGLRDHLKAKILDGGGSTEIRIKGFQEEILVAPLPHEPERAGALRHFSSLRARPTGKDSDEQIYQERREWLLEVKDHGGGIGCFNRLDDRQVSLAKGRDLILQDRFHRITHVVGGQRPALVEADAGAQVEYVAQGIRLIPGFG